LKSNFFVIKSFLPEESNRDLLERTLQRRSQFQTTTTETGAANYRNSLVLHDHPRWFLEEIVMTYGEALKELGMNQFEFSQIECQTTYHGDGCFYKEHTDNGSPSVSNRVLTFVYYFSQVPRRFSGGQLKIGTEYVEPENNTIVFFPSGLLHEVLPVRVMGDKFEEGRFTLNGWVRS